MDVINELEVLSEEINGVFIVKVIGRIDSLTTPVIERRLETLIKQGHCNIVLVMNKVLYISSIGLRLLSEVSTRLNQNKGKLVICSPSISVENVFRMTSFDLLFDIAENQEAALAYFNPDCDQISLSI